MEKKRIRSGAPFVVGALGVLGFSILFGLGGLGSYLIAALVFMLFYKKAKKRYPDREVIVEHAPHSGDSACDAMILEGRESLKKIRALNDRIADPALSGRIDSIENSCRLIFKRLEEQPAMLSSLRTFLRYYLPTTLKLLDARAKLENGVTSQAAAQMRRKVSDALVVIDDAFQKQLTALDEFRFLNLESEMDVLTDLLKSDGLIDGRDAPSAPQQGGTTNG
jgi:hypothetical protein